MEQSLCALCLKRVEAHPPNSPSPQDVGSLYKLLTLDFLPRANNGLIHEQDGNSSCSLCSTCTELIQEMGQIREQISQLQNQIGKRVALVRNMILVSDAKRLQKLVHCEVDEKLRSIREDLLRLTGSASEDTVVSTEEEVKMEPEDDFGEEGDQFLEEQGPCSSSSSADLLPEEAALYSSTDDDDLEEGESDSSFIINPQKTNRKQNVLRRSGRRRATTSARIENGNENKLKRAATPNSDNPTSPEESPKINKKSRKSTRKSLKCNRRHCSNRRHPNEEALARHDQECHFPWKCHICDNQSFNLHSQLMIHHKTQHPTIPFIQCSICKAEFLYTKSLEEHLFIQHETEDKAFSCDKCQKEFTLERNYKRHLALHIEEHEKPIVCEICDSRFPDQAQFDKHFVTHKTKICKLCSKAYANSASLKVHMMIHTGEKPVKCDDCDETFSSQDRKKTHMAKVHSTSTPDRNYLCSICGNTFSSAKSLKIHIDRHEGAYKMRCGQCWENFKDENALRKHRIEKHGDKPLICDECGAKFTSVAGHYHHTKFHHKTGEKPYKCDKCDAAFNYKCWLTQHVEARHSQLRAYPCPNCEAKFNSKRNLSSHVKNKHTEGYVRPTPYACSYSGCERKFEKKTKVEEHIRRAHTMERPFVCEVCNRGYPTRSNFNVHKKRWPEGTCLTARFPSTKSNNSTSRPKRRSEKKKIKA